MTTAKTFVIVGASLAGAKAAETLRTEGFDGRVGDEQESLDRGWRFIRLQGMGFEIRASHGWLLC